MSIENDNQDGQLDPTASQPESGFDEDNGEGSEFVTSEPKKPAVTRTTLVMFGVLALGAAGVWTMYQRIGGPQHAAAASTETVKAQQTINNFLSGGGSNIHNMEQMLRSTEKVVQQFLKYPSMTQVPLADLHTNPFRLKDEKPNTIALSDAAEKRKREEVRLAMLKNVQSLQLQSILCSDTRKACMINDVMYREGQTVEEFTVEKITTTSVIVKNGAYRFELRMQK